MSTGQGMAEPDDKPERRLTAPKPRAQEACQWPPRYKQEQVAAAAEHSHPSAWHAPSHSHSLPNGSHPSQSWPGAGETYMRSSMGNSPMDTERKV